MNETELDLSGLKCPLPALKVQKALTKLGKGDRLCVTCTDPLSAIDVPNLLRKTGDTLVASDKTGKKLVFKIEKN